jgi:hypothetical protein
LSEFIQAALIIAHFQRLAIIVDALNIKLDENKLETKNSLNINNNENINTIKNNMLKTLENINSINTDTEIKKGRTSVKSNLSDEPSDYDFKLDKTESNLESDLLENKQFNKHIYKYCNIYHDFDAHSEEYKSYLEFNWQDHAYYILQNLYPKGVDSINQEIEYLTTLTTNSLGEENSKLNTFPIRYSISCYIEKILGYYHEDYDYSNVNRLLVVGYKKFIKNVACYPQRLTQEDFKMMNLAFNNEEILHIILLVSIIKERTQLTYLANCLYEIIKTIE